MGVGISGHASVGERSGPHGRPRIAGAVLAAGSGQRMGRPKADLVVGGRRLLDRALDALRDGGCDPVLAVVRAGTALADGAVAAGTQVVVNADPGAGQRSSLACAVAAAARSGTAAPAPAGARVEALAVVLVDMPGVGARAVRAAVDAWRPGRIVAASYRGRRGHPIVMALADWERALAAADPEEGARAFLATQAGRVDEVPVEGDPADLDTPADLARWSTGAGRGPVPGILSAAGGTITGMDTGTGTEAATGRREPEQFDVRSGSASLAAVRWGTGPVRAVFLHAGVCDSRCWSGVAEQLPGGGWVAYDRRGFGGSLPATAAFSHLDDLVAVLDAVSPDVPVWLVGSSMGGGLALDAAIAVPERVAGLVLFAPAVSGRPEDDEDPPEIDALFGAVVAASKTGDLEEVNRLETLIWLDGPAGPEGRVPGPARELALSMNAIALANDPPGADHPTGDTGIDAWSRLAEIEVPVTLVWGHLDVEAPRIPALLERLATATILDLPHRAHLPYLEDPAQAAAIVADALAGD